MYRGQGDRRDMMEHLYRKLKEYANTGYYPFHMPGHKRNTALIGSELPYELDITEIDGFDDLHHSEGILKDVYKRQILSGTGKSVRSGIDTRGGI